MNLSDAKKKDLQRIGLMTAFYFLGRLKVSEPSLDLGSAADEEMAAMSEDVYVAESKRCLDELTNVGLRGGPDADAVDPAQN